MSTRAHTYTDTYRARAQPNRSCCFRFRTCVVRPHGEFRVTGALQWYSFLRLRYALVGRRRYRGVISRRLRRVH